jgi:hypothetical protein
MYGDYADASKIVGNPNKKTRCHLSRLGDVSKTSIWHPIKHKADEIVHARIDLQMVFEPRLERSRRGCFRLRDRSRWWPRILVVHAVRITPGERSPEEAPEWPRGMTRRTRMALSVFETMARGPDYLRS